MLYVLINYNFDPSWVKEYTDEYIIYDRSDKEIDFPHIRTENIGNVDNDRLTYLIDNYETLPDVFLLAKSNLFKFITKEEFDKVKDNKTFTPLLTQGHRVYEPICRYVDGIYEELNNSWYVPAFDHQFLNYDEWSDYMGLPNPQYLKFAPGGNYILTKKCVHKYSKDFYIKMRNTLNYTVLPAEAHFIERTYYSLWTDEFSENDNGDELTIDLTV